MIRLPPTLLSYCIRQALDPVMPQDEAYFYWHHADPDMMFFLLHKRLGARS